RLGPRVSAQGEDHQPWSPRAELSPTPFQSVPVWFLLDRLGLPQGRAATGAVLSDRAPGPQFRTEPRLDLLRFGGRRAIGVLRIGLVGLPFATHAIGQAHTALRPALLLFGKYCRPRCHNQIPEGRENRVLGTATPWHRHLTVTVVRGRKNTARFTHLRFIAMTFSPTVQINGATGAPAPQCPGSVSA